MRLQADPRLKQNQEDLQLLAHLQGLFFFLKEHGLVSQFDQAYPVATRINTLLRHGEQPREEDGAIEFWRLKNDLQNRLEYSQCWSDELWTKTMKRNVPLVSSFAKRFPAEHVVIPRTWIRKEVVFYFDRPQGEWDRVAESTMIKFSESGHLVFRATSPLS